jgi:hypothetical protein
MKRERLETRDWVIGEMRDARCDVRYAMRELVLQSFCFTHDF